MKRSPQRSSPRLVAASTIALFMAFASSWPVAHGFNPTTTINHQHSQSSISSLHHDRHHDGAAALQLLLGSSFGRRARTTRRYSMPPPSPAGDDAGAHSFVEGSEFGNEQDEIEALGGDPFFLGLDDDDNDNQIPPFAIPTTAGAAEKEPDADDKDDGEWEWDGTIDEDAHLDFE